ncbi:MAG: condensation domain-containing protein [Rhodococcus sp. (in: high G+C Gram-positive bacteria)]
MTSELDSAASPCETDIGDELTRIWAELLDLPLEKIARDASFLRLGGDSVLTVRMSALVRKRLEIALELSDVRVETTLGELVELVERRSSDEPARALNIEIARRVDPSSTFPLLPLQQGYFVGQQDGWELSYGSAHYYLDYALDGMESGEAEDALTDALERLARHQPTLRARVTPAGRQYVLPDTDPAAMPQVTLHDLRDLGEAEIEAALAEIRKDMSEHGPDPIRGPGIDVRLTLLPGERGRLHLGMSLLTFDGWSSGAMNRDLLAYAADWNATLVPLSIDFGDYVSSLSGLSRTEAWLADREWWWDRLDDLPAPPALPLVADPKSVRPVTMGNREARFSADEWAAMRAECTARDVTASTVMLTAFGTVLARWAGHSHLLLNALALNRLPLHPDVHRVVGAFAATMLVPLELDSDASFAELAASLQSVSSECSAHNLVSGVEAGRELARRRGTRRPPAPIVFQSVLGVDAAMGGTASTDAGPLGTVDIGDYFHQLRTPQVALEVRCFELGDEVVTVFSLVDEIFDEAEVSTAFAEFVSIVRGLAAGERWDAVPGLPRVSSPVPDDRLRLGLLPDPPVNEHSGPPIDDLEYTVCEVFEEFLDAPVLDRGANFFSLGGDSMLAVRVVALLARETGATIAIRDFLDDPTVAGTASAVRLRLGVVQ